MMLKTMMLNVLSAVAIVLFLMGAGYIGYRNGLSEMTVLKENFMSACFETATVSRCDRLWLIARGKTLHAN